MEREKVKGLPAGWRQDLVAFLIGCSYTFETAPINAHISLRHVQDGTNVVIHIISIPCQPAGVFSGPMVVSMRPIPQELVVRASRSPPAFGPPMALPSILADSELIDIADLKDVDWSEEPRLEKRGCLGILGMRGHALGRGHGSARVHPLRRGVLLV